MIAILDYGAGNLTSVRLAVEHVGGEALVTSDPGAVAAAERVIFPGVGSAGSCMASLVRCGLDASLRRAIAAGKPVLAICIGMQLLFDHSEEDAGVTCLGVLPGEVRRFAFPPERRVKVPHMGWNRVAAGKPHPLLAGLAEYAECYFVHSYHAAPADARHAYCETEYGGASFCSAAGRGNVFATQFHPEKSGEAGLGILRAFLDWDGGSGGQDAG